MTEVVDGAPPRVAGPLTGVVTRVLDVVGACVGLVLGAPVVAAGALAIWCSMGRPLFYSQERPGRHEKLFRVHKLRTMVDPVASDGTPVPEYDRVPRVGRFLRKTSIDELPQLWNVLRGEMSLVGPRPLLTRYLPHYSPEQRRRHEVRPGITGWAQVQRHQIGGWDEQLALDVWYVVHHSVRLDLEILVTTFANLLRGRGTDAAMDSLSKTTDGEKEFRG